MTKIHFSNGVTVNFNGTPTQKDIEEVSQHAMSFKPITQAKDESQQYINANNATQPGTKPEEPGFLSKATGDIWGGVKAVGESIQKAGEATADINASNLSTGGKILGTFGEMLTPFTEIGAQVIGTPLKIAGDIIQKTTGFDVNTAVENKVQQAVKAGLDSDTGKSILNSYQNLQKTNPEAANALAAALHIGEFAAMGVGAEAAGTAEKAGASVVKKGLEAVAPKIEAGAESVVARGYEKAAGYIEKRATERAIEAVSPELKGKSLIEAYKKGFGKTTKLGTQTLDETKDTIRIAEEFKDILKSTSPVKNLDALGKEMTTTEATLTGILEKDTTPVVKKAVGDTLDELKKVKPREYIKDPASSGVYDDAIDFAKEIVNKNEPNIKGLRTARQQFDQAAKNEFPSAFKNGYIDTKTAAGKAIKSVRDSLNNYAYDTAENGSEMKALIKREADIYKAVDNIAPKAAKMHGKNIVQRFVKKHPIAGSALKYGAVGAASAVAGKELGIIP